MKKVFTFFVFFILIAVSFAQYNPGDEGNHGKKRNAVYSDRFKKDKDGRWKAHAHWKKERDMQVDRINREYDGKIQSVKNRWFMGHAKRQRLVNRLEEQRREEIRRVYEKFNNRHSRFDGDHEKDG